MTSRERGAFGGCGGHVERQGEALGPLQSSYAGSNNFHHLPVINCVFWLINFLLVSFSFQKKPFKMTAPLTTVGENESSSLDARTWSRQHVDTNGPEVQFHNSEVAHQNDCSDNCCW